MKIIPGPHNSARALVLPNSLNPSQPYDQDSLNSLNITHYSGPCRIKLKFPTSVLTYSSFQCQISSPITLMPFVEFFFPDHVTTLIWRQIESKENFKDKNKYHPLYP